MKRWLLSGTILASVAMTACARAPMGNAGEARSRDAPAISLGYERYQLENGLDVILHVDGSDPIAAVALTFHVGSAREDPGRTGFAHLFEHLFFLDSENLGFGGLDRLMTRIGSSTNGSTSRDRTNYFEVVPIDGLEKALWAESDKLGFFINTVTEAVVAKEKQVVKNEKRQGVDNNPYGHVNFVLDRALYPEGHPYRWQVIGSLADLDRASLADVHEFHRRWYGPNNATLVVAGDLDLERTRAWIEQYFAEIPAREMPPTSRPAAVAVQEPVLLFHEDNFARLPQLTLAWPAPPVYHPDMYALDLLADLLADGKKAPLYQVVVEEEELAPAVSATNQSQEHGGRFTIQVRAFVEVDLDRVLAAAERAFTRFEERGVPADDLERVKAGYETSFYQRLSGVLGKAFQLAQYNLLAGSPGYLAEDLERLLAVTSADILRVYDTYLKDRPFVAASFVPRGEPELAVEGSRRAEVMEEPIVQGAEEELVVADRGSVLRTPSAIDRSVEPPFGAPPNLEAPAVWGDTLPNGLGVLGIESREIPLVQFSLRMKGGLLLDDPVKIGVANLLAETMTEGTARRAPEELEHAIDVLGASIDVSSGRESFVISGSTLARNYAATMAIVEEILLEPRFDPDEFELARQRVKSLIRQSSANPRSIGRDVFNHLLYGPHVLAENPRGTEESVDGITLDDLRAFHARALDPTVANFHVAGAVTREDVVASLAGIAERWPRGSVSFPPAPVWDPSRAGLYFVDAPDASQSVLRIGHLALSVSDDEYYPATVMNYRLGGGGFASDLMQVLREQRGYTYGISSGFFGSDLPGPFLIASGVRSNVTLESLQLVRQILQDHGRLFDEEDLETTKSFLLRANARAFETLGAKLGVLSDISMHGFPADYVLRREAVVRNMTIERARRLAESYLDPAGMIWLVVGDARTQRDRLSALGLGDPIPVDRTGMREGG